MSGGSDGVDCVSEGRESGERDGVDCDCAARGSVDCDGVDCDCVDCESVGRDCEFEKNSIRNGTEQRRRLPSHSSSRSKNSPRSQDNYLQAYRRTGNRCPYKNSSINFANVQLSAFSRTALDEMRTVRRRATGMPR